MHSRAACLLLYIALQACAAFQLPPLIVTSAASQSRHMFDRSSSRPPGTTYVLRSESSLTRPKAEGGDGGGEEGDGVDYSADPLTAFLGKFLPSGEKSTPPQAEDLASSVQTTCMYLIINNKWHILKVKYSRQLLLYRVI